MDEAKLSYPIEMIYSLRPKNNDTLTTWSMLKSIYFQQSNFMYIFSPDNPFLYNFYNLVYPSDNLSTSKSCEFCWIKKKLRSRYLYGATSIAAMKYAKF